MISVILRAAFSSLKVFSFEFKRSYDQASNMFAYDNTEQQIMITVSPFSCLKYWSIFDSKNVSLANVGGNI